ncbi:TPA: peptidase, M56 family protein [Clostridioides difficile]|nr:peptidase, M56 family protein [Clostridioides difficile]
MNDLLKIILSLSFSGALLIIIMLFIGKVFFRGRTNHRWKYYIWLIIIARLLIPLTPDISLTGRIFEKTDIVMEQIVETTPTDGTVNITPVEKNNYDTNDNSDTTFSLIHSFVSVLFQNLGIIWLIVSLILLIRKITIYQGFVKYIKAGREEVSSIELLNTLSRLGTQIGVNCPVEFYTNELISSPLLIGFFRPCIILPTTNISEDDLKYTLLHELTHFKRKDMFYKWLVQITICLHWFNPLVYIMGHEISRECELSCDEEMIRTLNEKERRKYGDTLLHAMALGGKYKDTVSSVTLNESKELLKERLGAIINFKENSKAAKTIMLGLTLLLIVCSIIIGAYTIKNKPMQYSSDNSIQNFSNDNRSDNLAKVSSDDLSGISENLNLSLDIENGGIVILPSTSNELQAVYDSEYYDVQLTDQNGEWIVTVSGKAERMGDADEVQLYLPDIKTKMNVNVSNGDFSYNLPEDCQNEVDITAANGGVYFASSNHYANSDISLVAQERTFIVYEEPVYPNYFTRTDTGFSYKNGTGLNKISISLIGYTSVEFQEL